jgi:serine protease Do
MLLTAPAAAQPVAPSDFTAIVQQKSPAVVGVGARQSVQASRGGSEVFPDSGPFADLFRGPGRAQQQVRQALGSGFIISEQGHIVTNNHVINHASEIQVIFADKSTATARLIGHDPSSDIAVLKIDPRPDMPVLSWGDSEAMQPGAWTIAIGSPFGLGGTVTVGVLSARSRDIQSGPYDDYLQTDASINRGNSGGPLFNAAGEVVGVNTAIISPGGGNIGIGFAVPARIAKNVTDQLIRTGRVERGYLGVSIQQITPDIAQALGMPAGASGALAASVQPGSPAARAGIQPGDVITSFAGQAVKSPGDLSRAVADQKPGTSSSVTVRREGDDRTFDITLGQRPGSGERGETTGSTSQESTRLGVALAPINEAERRRLGIEGSGGVLVTQVQPNSPASEKGLKSGDVILRVGKSDVQQPADVADAWAAAAKQKKALLLRVKREDQYMFVAVTPS